MKIFSFDNELSHLLRRIPPIVTNNFPKKSNHDYNVAFVILQYNHFQFTFDCIKTLQNLVHNNSSFIIVDNASTDGSDQKIKEFYNNDSSVHILLTSENLGYAQGNNLGYKYAKTILKSDFICVINNDIKILDSHFLLKVFKEYSKYHFSILGPDIILTSFPQLHQNIFRKRIRTYEETIRIIERREKQLEQLKSGQLVQTEHEVFGRKKKYPFRRFGQIVLHGSAYIFSPIFISDFDEPFDHRTFLYGEEDILALRALIRGHRIMYSPKIHVYHHANASTDKTCIMKHIIFRRTHSIESAKIYKSILSDFFNHCR